MIIWDYIKTIEACKSACSVSEFGHNCNYSGKTTWGYWELQVFNKLEYGPCYYMKTQCKTKQKTRVCTSCESNVEWNCKQTKSYREYYENFLIYIPLAIPSNS